MILNFKQSLEDYINDGAEIGVMNLLSEKDKISIDDLAFEALWSVDEIKLEVWNRMENILKEKGIKIEE